MPRSDAGTVLVTGASSGIGKATALLLAERGFEVFAGVRKDEDGRQLQAEAKGRLHPVRLDVTDEQSIAAAVQEVSRHLNGRGLNGLVNNAGIAIGGPLEHLPLATFRQQLEVNVTGVLAVSQAFLPLIRQAQGRIITIGSMAGKLATPMTGAYASSKFAVEALNDALRRELEPWGLQVALIEPGRIRTPIWDKALTAADQSQGEMPPIALERYGAQIRRTRQRALQANQQGAPPERVAEAVHHALTAARPRTRYPVGTDARAVTLLTRFLPDRWVDALLVRVLRGRSRG